MHTALAPAKLNLYLHIHGTRADGYHLVESLAVFAQLGDEVTVEAADQLSFTCEGPFAEQAGGGEGNLVLKAARLLQAKTGCRKGARITLRKEIPVGAGLGGGSADAATVLKLLNHLWQLDVAEQSLQQWAPELGADVAMCLAARPVIAEGIGEQLTPLTHPLPAMHAVLVHPRTPLLTKDVYAALAAPKAVAHAPVYPMLPPDSFDAFIRWLSAQRNDLETPAMQVSVTVGQVLTALRACQPTSPLVRMSGSGACCYALYATAREAQQARDALRLQYPAWWVEATMLAV